jgi:gamma-glutamyltranspeptidase / glutathione hydrolase
MSPIERSQRRPALESKFMRVLRSFVLLMAIAACVFARQPVRARHAMVVTRESNATRAGLKILQAGGNAVDAAVAVGFALAVTHPAAGNLGGGGFMLVRRSDGTAVFLDFRERAPLKASRDMYLDASGRPTQDSRVGYRASGVPGTVRGLELAHRKFGSRKWSELLEPAVQLAAQGFPVSHGLAQSLKASRQLLGSHPESKRIFLSNGTFYEPGDRLTQPELARTLARIRDQGSRGFYEGETARALAADMVANGGLIGLEDLRAYEAVERKPLAGRFRNLEILTAPPPSSGGIGILQMLGMLEGTDYQASGAGSAASLHYLAEVMRRFFADRSRYLGDPDFVSLPVDKLLSREYIERQRASIDPARATPSTNLAPAWPEPSQTTHYTVVDAEGNVAAVTYTLNGSYGSGVTARGLGFLLNNEMDDFAAKPGHPNLFGLVQGEANAIAPRKRPLSSMTPTIVLRGGRFYMALGSPGGPTIINTVLQVLVNVVDFGMNIQEAVDWPRIHHQWLPDELIMERGFSPDTVALLKSRGHQVRIRQSIGDVAAVLSAEGWLQGAADGRSEATAEGY